MSRHTPGPWVADEIFMENDRRTRVGTTDGSLHYYHTSRTICECAVGDGEDDSAPGLGEAEANARLIAAAPEMHKALTVALGAIVSGVGLSLAETLIREAIAKAEGRS